MHCEFDADSMSASETKPPPAPKPKRRKIPPPVPPRTHSLKPFAYTTLPPQVIPVQQLPRGKQYVNLPNRSHYATIPSSARPVKPPVAPRVSSLMAASGGCTSPRYYGRDEAINVVMEDITNIDMENAVDDSVSLTSSPPTESSPPVLAVAPMPKPRTATVHPISPDTHQHIPLHTPEVVEYDLPYQKNPEPSIVERIIRTHPIWYLKANINREITAHLLSDAEPGNFIVRPSSKPRCAALSVRILQSAGRMTHHFVIETLGVGKVRLQGSRLSFPSLPALIEYYHVHGFAMMPGSRDESTRGELLCSLQLPQIILEAHSTEELMQIASIGPAFWNWNNVPPMAHHVSNIHPRMDEACTSLTVPNGNGILHKRSNSHNDPVENSTLTRQSWQRSSDHKPHYYDSNQWNYVMRQDRPGVKLTREGSLNTHTSRRDAETAQISAASRRSKSVRDTKPREPGRKKSFFGSIFGSQKEQKKRAGTPDLAHCTAFQVDQEAIKRSYGSAFEIGEPKIKSSTYGKTYTHNNGVPTMRTFKPLPGELTNVGRPLPPKPGEIDLVNAASARRLAKHNEGSPGPPKSPEARKAMRPPGPTIDYQLKQNCLEELRRKRLQTQHEMLNAVSPVTGSPKLTPRSLEKFYRVPGALKSPKKDHRLSVPDLLDLPQPTLAQESARALRERLGRNEIGELGAINEGLITPVVRRKAFPIRHEIPYDINHSSTSVSTTDGSDTYGEQRNRSSEAGYGCIYNGTSRQAGHPSPSVQRKESELIWRRNSAKQPVPETPPAPKSNRSGCIFPDRSGGAWSAIATELTARQAASKRRSGLMNLDHTIPSFHGHKMTEPGTSEYTPLQDLHDELEREAKESEGDHQDDDAISVAGTVFNEPWDSNIWDNLMFLADHKDKGASDSARKRFETVTEDQENEQQDSPPRQIKTLDRTDPNISWDNASQFSTLDSRRKPLSVVPTLGGTATPGNSMMSLPRSRSRYSHGDSCTGSVDDLTIMFPCISPFDEPPAVAHEIAESSRIIQDYIDQLNEDPSTYTFKTISVFIECTRASHEFDPNVVIRNVRQFINGMKNFYQKQGEGDLHAIFVDQRNRLSVNHILNFDAIAESILHRILTKKLKAHLYRVKIDRIGSDGYLDVISKNLHMIREFSLEQLGFSQSEATSPSPGVMDEVKQCFKRMSCHYNPMKKVECLMQGIGAVLKTQRAPSPDIDNNPKIPRVEIICRWLVYLFARCSFVAAEIECWYMMELLPKQVLEQGDVTYYLNAMLAAVHLLNNADLLRNMKQKDVDLDHMATLPRIKPPSSKTDIFVKIAIPDIALGNIKYYTFPILPLVPSVKFCRIIAHQQGITNPDCYGLYIVMDGYATPVQPHEFPDGIRDKLNGTGKSFYFAYQQHGSKIAWPCEKIQGEQLQGLNLC